MTHLNMSPSAPCPDAAARKPWRGAGARIKGFLSADCGYRLGVAVATANRHPATSAFGWLAVNFAWFLATWAAVASLVAAAFMIGEGDHFTAPRSLEEILSVPVVLVVFGDGGDRRNRRLVLVRTGVDTGPRPLPGGALVGWPRSSLAPAPRRRRRAVAARCRLLVFAGGVQWVSFQLAALAAAIVYGCLVKLPAGTESV
jgi:hypothetical protein